MLVANNNALISYVFRVEGVVDGPHTTALERALEEIDGVHAHVVYPTNTAWVTAPRATDVAKLITAFEDNGVTATLTDSSIHRRDREESFPLRTRAVVPDRTMRVAQRAGWFIHSKPVPQPLHDTLYTPRHLITWARVIIAIVLTVPVLALTYMEELQFYGWQWVLAVVSAPVVIWCAWPFHRAFLGGVRRGVATLDGASSIAVVSAYLWSLGTLFLTPAGDPEWSAAPDWFGVFNEGPEFFYDVACGITALLLFGRRLSLQTRPSLAADVARERVDPESEVTVVYKGQHLETPVNELNPGDDVSLKPGQRVPFDGMVVGGSATIRPSVVEPSGRRTVSVDDTVFAGALIIDKPLKIRVVRSGHGTRAAAVERWVGAVQNRLRKRMEEATKTASRIIPIAFFVAVLAGIVWYVSTRHAVAAFAVYLSVLAVVAPTAYALAAALPLRLGVEVAARRGILVREGVTFRTLRDMDTVVFNRVGSLVEQEMTVRDVTVARGEDPELVLRVAAALCMESNHPASQALVHAARQSRDNDSGRTQYWVDVEAVDIDVSGNFTARIELKVGETTHEVDARLWRPRHLAELRGPLGRAAVSGGTPLVVSWDGKDRGVISLRDRVKDDAVESINQLEYMGLSTVLLSRDTYPVARRFASRLGMSQVLAGMAAGDKPKSVRGLKVRGAHVAMVGDVSVTEVLKVADAGILLSDTVPVLPTEEEDRPGRDAVIMRRDVSAVPELFRMARSVCQVVDRNYAITTVYNIAGVAVALSGVLHPMAATLLMLVCSLLVDLGSNTVRR